MKEARDGPHTGYWQNARLKVMASEANSAKPGVLMWSYPEGET